jgi:hypothetical protein
MVSAISFQWTFYPDLAFVMARFDLHKLLRKQPELQILKHIKSSGCSRSVVVWFKNCALVCNYFMEDTLAQVFSQNNFERYVRLILPPFFDQIKTYRYSVQYNTTAHNEKKISGCMRWNLPMSHKPRTVASAITLLKSLWLLFVGHA